MFSFLKIISSDLKNVNLELVRSKVESMNDSKMYEEVSNICSSRFYEDPEWNILAGRVILHEMIQTNEIPSTFSESMALLDHNLNPAFRTFVQENSTQLNEMIVSSRDHKFDAFGIGTLKANYLSRIASTNSIRILETPQYMYLRVATYLHMPDLVEIKKCYDHLSLWDYTHATPTLFNAGTKRSALSSCFKMTTSDTLDGLAKAWTQEGIISKNSGGLGKDMSKIRHSQINSTSGMSKGVVPWLKIDEAIVSAVDQGGKRNGSMAVYLKIWHIDVFDFIDAANANNKNSAPDLFYGLMVCDLFMKRLSEKGVWSLFCPGLHPELTTVWGEEFEKIYLALEAEGKYSKQVSAKDLMDHIIRSQLLTGKPYICYIDSMNRKCNQTSGKDMVDISNLCTEITGVSTEKEIFSCNLAAISLNSCVKSYPKTRPRNLVEVLEHYDFKKLADLSMSLVVNLNETIDRNYYHPDIPEIRYGNFRRRPIGIGVQGLADTFAMLKLNWSTDDGNAADPVTRLFHKCIFETIYIAAVRKSIEMAKIEGCYPTFQGSHTSHGLFQFDLWEAEKLGVSNEEYLSKNFASKRYTPLTISTAELEHLRTDMIRHGLRNSLLTALMPTASSAHIIGNNESFEPINNMIFNRKVLSGNYTLINKHFIRDAKEAGLWNTHTYDSIIDGNGTLEKWSLPSDLTGSDSETFLKITAMKELKLRYKSIWDIKQKILVDYCADRSWFICQSQSLNCHMKHDSEGNGKDNMHTKMFAYHMYTWKCKLKTGLYYLRQLAASTAINFTKGSIRIGSVESASNSSSEEEFVCKRNDPNCMACSV